MLPTRTLAQEAVSNRIARKTKKKKKFPSLCTALIASLQRWPSCWLLLVNTPVYSHMLDVVGAVHQPLQYLKLYVVLVLLVFQVHANLERRTQYSLSIDYELQCAYTTQAMRSTTVEDSGII